MDKLAEGSIYHALNLLRSIFLNTQIRRDTFNYLESATTFCFDAPCSFSLLVRNSSPMLYSTLNRHGIGVHRERKDEETFISTIKKELICSY